MAGIGQAAVEYIVKVATDPQLFAEYAMAPILRRDGLT